MKLDWPTDRIDYSPIPERPPLLLPGGAKVVVWPCINVENWVIDAPMPRTVVNPPGGVAKSVPDIPNWAWHEYGQRVAFWRLKKIFDEFGVASCIWQRTLSLASTAPTSTDRSPEYGCSIEMDTSGALPPADEVGSARSPSGS